MALFNYATKEITLKIVYYGPGLSGKTTNIEYLHTSLDQTRKGKLLSLSTEADRTLFFDFLPVEVGKIKDFTIRFQLYTVPGQVRYNATRKLVLKGADAVVFVADSQRDMKEANIESFENMRENLLSNDLDPDDIPVVLQYNKRDLPNLMTIDELNIILNKNGHTHFEAVAINGDGVHETFQAVTKQLIKHIALKHKIDIQAKESTEEIAPPPLKPVPKPVMEDSFTPGAHEISFEEEPTAASEMPEFDMVGTEDVEISPVKGFQDHEAVMEESASREFDPDSVFPDENDEETIEVEDTDDKSIESIYKAFMSDEKGKKSSFSSAGLDEIEMVTDEAPSPQVQKRSPEPAPEVEIEAPKKDALADSLKSFRSTFKSSYNEQESTDTAFSLDKKDIFADIEKTESRKEELSEVPEPVIEQTSLIEEPSFDIEEPPAPSRRPTPSPVKGSASTGDETLNIVLDEINSVARTMRKLNDSITSLKAEIASISRKVDDIEEQVQTYQEETLAAPPVTADENHEPASLPEDFLETINSLKQDIENAKKKKLWFLFS